MSDELDDDSEDNEIIHVPPRARSRAMARIRRHMDEMGRDEALLQEFATEDGLRLNQATLTAFKDEIYRRHADAVAQRRVEDDYRDFEAGTNLDIKEIDLFITRNTAEVLVEGTGEKQTIYIDSKAHIAAVKARHELRKSKIDYKQSLGIIKRAAATPGHHNGRALGDMEAEELREAAMSLLKSFQGLVGKYGGKTIDVTPGAPALPEGRHLERPQFTDDGAPAVARGGLSKTAGARAANR